MYIYISINKQQTALLVIPMSNVLIYLNSTITAARMPLAAAATQTTTTRSWTLTGRMCLVSIVVQFSSCNDYIHIHTITRYGLGRILFLSFDDIISWLCYKILQSSDPQYHHTEVRIDVLGRLQWAMCLSGHSLAAYMIRTKLSIQCRRASGCYAMRRSWWQWPKPDQSTLNIPRARTPVRRAWGKY